MNPIMAREVRSRWRDRRAFGLLLGYAALLSLAVAYSYSEALPAATQNGAQNAAWRAASSRAAAWRTAEIGHTLFMTLSWMQALGWMLLAPTLTASAIAGERERGLLEGLQLSPLTGPRIVLGKLASALFFILLLMLAALPVVAICFLLGGVSPGEFALATLLHAVTATTCATVGLFFSAWSRRAATALRATFVVLTLWGVGSLICFLTAPGRSNSAMSLLFHLFGKTNPVMAAVAVGDPMAAGPGARFFGPPITTSSSFVVEFLNILAALPPWAVSLAFQLLLVPLLLWSSARALRRPFAEQYWIEGKRAKAANEQAGEQADATSHPAGKANDPAGDARRGGNAMWWELPVGRLLRFSNPVLQREARGKFRMRRVPLWVIVFEAALGVFVAYFYGRAVWLALAEPDARQFIWWVLTFIGLIVVMISSAAMGAGAFSRERESGTFEPLLLSVLPSRDIIWGKLAAPLLACCVFALPFVPLLALCVRGVDYRPGLESVSLTQAAAAFGVIAATAWCYTAWGMLISWHCRRTAAAVGWTLGTLFLANVFMPLFFGRASDSSFQPIAALAQLASPDADSARNAIIAVATLFVAGCVFLAVLHGAMRRRARERDAKRGAARQQSSI